MPEIPEAVRFFHAAAGRDAARHIPRRSVEQSAANKAGQERHRDVSFLARISLYPFYVMLSCTKAGHQFRCPLRPRRCPVMEHGNSLDAEAFRLAPKTKLQSSASGCDLERSRNKISER